MADRIINHNENYMMFRFYRGEKENPFDNVLQNAEYQFWGYEEIFENLFSKDDFSLETWIVPYAEDVKEWKEVLENKPVIKEDLFKLWLYRLLMEHLPDKYDCFNNRNDFLTHYFKTATV